MVEININSFTFGRENKNDDDDNKNPDDIPSGRSSPAKHGDAYFSAIYGFMKYPIVAPVFNGHQSLFLTLYIRPERDAK